MNFTITTILLVVAGLGIGLLLGWKLGTRHLRRSLKQSLAQRNESSLELLKARKHVRTLSSHIKSSLASKKELVDLRQKLGSAQQKINQQKRYLDAQEKAHFVESANLKLALMEASLPITENQKRRPTKPLRSASNVNELCDLQDAHPKIRANLKAAGISNLRQLASLSQEDIDALTRNQSAIPVLSKR